MTAPPPALLDRRLLFFTGKGGVGKSTVTAAFALLAARHGKRVLVIEVDAKGNLTDLFEHRPVGFDPAEVHPGVFAMTMNTEDSLQRVPEAASSRSRCSDGSDPWPGARLRRERGAGREGDPHGRQGVLGGARGARGPRRLGPRDRRRRRDRPHRRPARRARRDPGARAGRAGAPADRVDDRAPLRPGDHRAQRGRDARGDAGQRDDRARRDRPRGAVGAARRGDRQPGAARALHPRRRGRVRRAPRTPPAGRGARRPRSVPACPAVLDGARLAVSLRRTRAVHLTRLRTTLDLPMLYVPYLFVRDPRPARHPDGRRRARRGAAACEHAASGDRRRRALESLLAAKEIVVFCGSGGVGKTSVAAAQRARRRPRRLGGKVLVLTIDPARRLASALGLDGIGNAERRVPDDLDPRPRASSRGASSTPRCSTPRARGTSWCSATRPTR